MCEINPYCQKVLKKHWPNVPLFEDIKKLKGEDIGTVDVIYGGFPCQPFSVAGLQKGKEDNRYLWPEFSRLVGELKPHWVIAENVPGILRIAADDVCSDLERQGYAVGIWDFEAAAVGAKHRRERVFFVAHSEREFCQSKRPGGYCFLQSCSLTPDSDGQQCEEQRKPFELPPKHAFIERVGRWEPEPRVDRVAHGLPHRVDRLRALGNAVVPQQVYPIFKAIIDIEEQ